MLPHLSQAEEIGQVYPQELRESLAISPLPNLCLLFPAPLQPHTHLPYVLDYQRALHTLHRGVAPGEVSYQDLMVVMDQVAIQTGSRASGHVDGIWLVIPAIPQDFSLDPVDDWAEINLVSGVNDGTSKAAPCLCRSEVTFQEDPHAGGGKVDNFSDANGVNARVVCGKRPQKVHLGVDGQGGIYRLCYRDIDCGENIMQAYWQPVGASDGTPGYLDLRRK